MTEAEMPELERALTTAILTQLKAMQADLTVWP